MKTILTDDPQEAADVIKRGGLAAFPTETVYGLGADVFNEAAISKIFEAKRRPADNPLIAHISDLSQIEQLVSNITETANLLINAYFPGPLTIVLQKAERVPLIATAGLDTIGIRMPALDVTNRFLAACETPVAAPSANLSGRPSPTTWEAVFEDLNGRIDCILKGNAADIGLESTVVDCTGDVPVLLRQGAVSLAELRGVVAETVEYDALSAETPRSPGLKHKHYTPNAKVMIVSRESTFEPESGAAYIGINKSPVGQDLVLSKVCGSVQEYAQSLFEFFRECDRAKIQTVYCEEVYESGIGAALMDRLRRAADN